MHEFADIVFLGAVVFGIVLAIAYALVQGYGVHPQKFVQWLLGAGFLLIVLGAVAQSASRDSAANWQRILHQTGACIVLSAFVLFVAIRRLGEQFSIGRPAAPRRLTVDRSTTLPPGPSADGEQHLRHVEHCVFDGGRVTSRWGRLLVQMRNLSELDLRRAELDPDAISWLSCLNQLDVLRVSSSSFTIRELRIIQVGLPACRVETEAGVLVDHLTAEGRVRQQGEAGDEAGIASDEPSRNR